VDCDSSCPYNKVVYSSSKIDSDNGTRTQTIYHANGILVTTVTDLSPGQVTSKTSKNIDTGVEDSTKYTGNTDYYGNATYYTVSKSMNGTTTITDVGENQSSLILTYPSGDTEVDRHIPVDANTPVQNYTKEINRMIFDSETYTVDEYKNIIEYHDIYSQGREILKKYTYEGETYKGYTVKTITENGSGTLEVFDATNTLVSSTVINYDGSYGRVTEYSVDDKGYKTETVTTKGYENETYVYETTYDTNGKKIRSSTSISSADGSTTVTDYTYDSNGKLTSSTSTQNGQTTTTKYNPGTYKPTQTTTTNSDGTTTVTDYTYDSNGNKTATTATTFDANEKETSTVKTTYDAKSGHVLTEDGKTSDGYTYNKEYKKDSHGNWVGTGSDSFSQSYTYDDNGNTTQYKVVDFDGTVKEERNYTYEDGKLVSSDYAYSSGDSGSSTTTYNPDGSYTTTRERNSANGTYYAEIVNYDSSKNPTSAQTTTTADGKTKTYDYDSSGRVTGYTETYSDKHGNQYKNTYDRSGQLLSSTSDLLRIYTLPEAYAITTKNSSNSFLIRYR
jgi:YD repeat-containing protein